MTPQSHDDAQASNPLQPLHVPGPVGGAHGRNTSVPVQIYALGAGVAVKGNTRRLLAGKPAFELEGRTGTFCFWPGLARAADWPVAAVEGDVEPIGQTPEAVDQKVQAELLGLGGHGVSPAVKTAIVSLPIGCGKTTVRHELAARLGCTLIIDEWSPDRGVTPGALHLTNANVTRAGDRMKAITYAPHAPVVPKDYPEQRRFTGGQAELQHVGRDLYICVSGYAGKATAKISLNAVGDVCDMRLAAELTPRGCRHLAQRLLDAAAHLELQEHERKEAA